MLGFAALGRLALGRFKQTANVVAVPAAVGTIAFVHQVATLRLGFAAHAGAASAGGQAARFGHAWRAGGGTVALSVSPAVLRPSVAAQTGAAAALGYAAGFRLTLRADPVAIALNGPSAYLSKTTPGGGDDHVITFRAGGPAFTRRRYGRMLAEQAAQAAAAREAQARAEVAARATAAAAAARAADAQQRRWDDQDRTAALIQAALGQRHAQQGLAGARAVAGIGRDATVRMAAAAQAAAARIQDDDEALAMLLAA